MPSKKILTPIEPGAVYHIYNRGSNYQDVFFDNEDYQLFLDRFKFYLKDVCSLYSFALLPNHYHFLLRINESLDGKSFSKQYVKFVLSYTNKINFKLKRNGSLFLACFRRIKINDQDYLKRLVYYIHHNSAKHGIVDDYRKYRFSSYQAFVSEKPTSLDKDVVISWFGSLADFIEYHNYLQQEDKIQKLTFEDD